MPSPDLDALQRWMQSVIVHPGGVAAGLQSAAAQAEIELSAGTIEELIGRSQRQTSLERLAVYSNAYQARLLEVLIGEYPALVHALGEEAFAGLAAGYLNAHPPGSYTLADLGRSFPDYLSQTRPPKQHGDGPGDWADFLIDLARLERIYSEVFDGPGIEGCPPLHPDRLRSLSADQWLAARLVPAPCLRLVTLRFPVHEYASSVRRGQVPEPAASQSTWLAVTRREYVVRRASLGADEFHVLSQLVAGQTIGNALQSALATIAGTADDAAARLNLWFHNWSAAGYFTEIQVRTPVTAMP